MDKSLDFEDRIESIKSSIRDIENNLEDFKKLLDILTKMRVQTAHRLADLIKVIDAHAWDNVSEFIGRTRCGVLDMDKE